MASPKPSLPPRAYAAWPKTPCPPFPKFAPAFASSPA